MSSPLRSPAATDAPPARPSRLRRYAIRVLVSAALAGICLWLLHAGTLRLLPDRAALRGVDVGLCVAGGLLLVVSYLVRAARWQFLLRPVASVPTSTVVRVSLISFAALVLLPLRAGEVVRPLLIRRSGKISAWAATGTVGAERIIDGLFLSVILFAALSLSRPLDPLPDRIGTLPVNPRVVPHAAYAALALFAAAFASMGAFYLWRDAARRALHAVLDRISPRLAEYAAQRLELVSAGLRFLPRARHTVPFLIATALYWFSNAGCFWLLGLGSGFSSMSFVQACVTMGVVALGIVLPSAPGFFGAFQLSVYAALSLYFAPAELAGRGSAYVFLVYLCQIGVTLLSGAVAALFEPTRLSGALEEGAEPAGSA